MQFLLAPYEYIDHRNINFQHFHASDNILRKFKHTAIQSDDIYNYPMYVHNL